MRDTVHSIFKQTYYGGTDPRWLSTMWCIAWHIARAYGLEWAQQGTTPVESEEQAFDRYEQALSKSKRRPAQPSRCINGWTVERGGIFQAPHEGTYLYIPCEVGTGSIQGVNFQILAVMSDGEGTVSQIAHWFTVTKALESSERPYLQAIGNALHTHLQGCTGDLDGRLAAAHTASTEVSPGGGLFPLHHRLARLGEANDELTDWETANRDAIKLVNRKDQPRDALYKDDMLMDYLTKARQERLIEVKERRINAK